MAVLWRYIGSSYDAADGSQTDIPHVLCEYQHAYVMKEWVLSVLLVQICLKGTLCVNVSLKEERSAFCLC